MAVQIGFVKLCSAVTADGDISNLYKYTWHLLPMATTSNQIK